MVTYSSIGRLAPHSSQLNQQEGLHQLSLTARKMLKITFIVTYSSLGRLAPHSPELNPQEGLRPIKHNCQKDDNIHTHSRILQIKTVIAIETSAINKSKTNK